MGSSRLWCPTCESYGTWTCKEPICEFNNRKGPPPLEPAAATVDLQQYKSEKAQSSLKQMAESIAQMKGYADVMVEFYAVEARLLYDRYTALMGAGFSKEQALDVIKAKGFLG